MGEVDAERGERLAPRRRESVVEVVAWRRQAVLVRGQRVVRAVAADDVASLEQRGEDGDAESAREMVVARARGAQRLGPRALAE
jgi:hypothetical protein